MFIRPLITASALYYERPKAWTPGERREVVDSVIVRSLAGQRGFFVDAIGVVDDAFAHYNRVAGGSLEDRKVKGGAVALLFLLKYAFLRFIFASFSPLRRYSTHSSQLILSQNNTGMVGLNYLLPARL